MTRVAFLLRSVVSSIMVRMDMVRKEEDVALSGKIINSMQQKYEHLWWSFRLPMTAVVGWGVINQGPQLLYIEIHWICTKTMPSMGCSQAVTELGTISRQVCSWEL